MTQKSKGLLASFCFSTTSESLASEGLFRMPPICMDPEGMQLQPDFGPLLLFDEFIVDRISVERMRSVPAFSSYVELIDALDQAGKLVTKDFAQTLGVDERLRIGKYVSDLCQDPSIWTGAFTEAVDIWKDFEQRIKSNADKASWRDWRNEEDQFIEDIAKGMIQGLDERLVRNLSNWNDDLKQKYRDFTIRIVSGYVEHVLAHVRLGNVLSASPIDWQDIYPIYRSVLAGGGQADSQKEQRTSKTARRLYEITPPLYRPETADRFVEMLHHRNIADVRNLIRDARDGKIELDSDMIQKKLDNAREKFQLLQAKHSSLKLLVSTMSSIPIIGSVASAVTGHVSDQSLANRAVADDKWLLVFSDPRSTWIN